MIYEKRGRWVAEVGDRKRKFATEEEARKHFDAFTASDEKRDFLKTYIDEEEEVEETGT